MRKTKLTNSLQMSRVCALLNSFQSGPNYTKELSRRRKSKKARRRLIRSILKKKSANGVFERAVIFHNLCVLLANPIKQAINYDGFARQIFRVTNLEDK